MTRSATPSNPNVALLSTIRMWMTMAPDSIVSTSLPVGNDITAFSDAAETERKSLIKQIDAVLAPAASTNS